MSLAKQEISAALGKEFLVEWCLQQWDLGLVNDLSASNLTKMSMLDTHLLETAYIDSPATVYTGLDLHTALKLEVDDVGKEASLRDLIATIAVPENQELYKQVERLIDDERAGDLEEPMIKELQKRNLRTKVSHWSDKSDAPKLMG